MHSSCERVRGIFQPEDITVLTFLSVCCFQSKQPATQARRYCNIVNSQYQGTSQFKALHCMLLSEQTAWYHWPLAIQKGFPRLLLLEADSVASLASLLCCNSANSSCHWLLPLASPAIHPELSFKKNNTVHQLLCGNCRYLHKAISENIVCQCFSHSSMKQILVKKKKKRQTKECNCLSVAIRISIPAESSSCQCKILVVGAHCERGSSPLS